MVGVLVRNQDSVQMVDVALDGREASQRFAFAKPGVDEDTGALCFEQRQVARTAGPQNGNPKADWRYLPGKRAANAAAQRKRKLFESWQSVNGSSTPNHPPRWKSEQGREETRHNRTQDLAAAARRGLESAGFPVTTAGHTGECLLRAPTYKPKPIATSKVKLTREIKGLIEKLSRNTHEVWAQQRLKDGWTYGKKRNDARKTHPDLVGYDKLTETEKNYDRVVVTQVVKVILALGYEIKKR